ncbi:DUF6236 family protein [Propionispora vibrioides]|uniref:Uncharacterized protein n=1 Tax=Propionispora vibrioides TaxID=112903 RepID=A0A1H8SIU9_9FIRM|nr:DUF6236 family protein [Propionispora vibrioides]SEO78487.1 hypothetical protein SAMN04490178_10579 [Propionispora vibrioides]
MAVLTKHIAEGKSPYTVPVTDTLIARDLLYCSPEHTNHLGINLILENIFPSPGNDVPLQDIIEFRIRRQDELKQFKDIMSNYFAEVSRIKDVTII